MTNKFVFLEAFAPLFYSDKTYFMLEGGRGSGKTTQICAWILIKLMSDEYARIVVSRYTEKSLKNSIYQDLLDMIHKWNLTPYLHITASSIENKTNGNQITTYSFKLSENSQSAKSKGLSNPNILIIEEATEIPDEQEVIKLIDSFRFKGAKRKIIFAFNPDSKAHWLFKKYYLPDGSPNPKWFTDYEFIHTTYKDNLENLDPLKVEEWERAKVTDPEYYNHHILGKWREVGQGQIFKTWKWETFKPDPEAEILYGLDFGFVDPCVVVKTYKKGKTLWVEEIIYQSGITTEDLYLLMEKAGVDKRAVIYADAADPSSIETLRRMGYVNIRKAEKGPDSVKAGIDKIRTFAVYANPASNNLMEEYNKYSYREGLDQPIDDYNHLIDAFRYSLSHTRVQTGEQSRYAVISRGRNSKDIW